MSPSKPIDPERLFNEQLPLIDKQIRFLCRRKCLNHQDADDFASYVRERLWQNNYAVLAKFRGESSLQAFLASTLGRMLQDYRIQKWGRWRPSAAAHRLGWLAIELERLTGRDHLSFREACETLRQNDPQAASEETLEAIWVELPHRVRVREVDEASMPYAVESAERADHRVEESAAGAEADEFEESLTAVLSDLDSEERTILKLRFWEQMTIAGIARVLDLDQKRLYRRIDQLKTRLRRELFEAGIDAERFNRWVGRAGFEPRIAIDDEDGENS